METYRTLDYHAVDGTDIPMSEDNDHRPAAATATGKPIEIEMPQTPAKPAPLTGDSSNWAKGKGPANV